MSYKRIPDSYSYPVDTAGSTWSYIGMPPSSSAWDEYTLEHSNTNSPPTWRYHPYPTIQPVYSTVYYPPTTTQVDSSSTTTSSPSCTASHLPRQHDLMVAQPINMRHGRYSAWAGPSTGAPYRDPTASPICSDGDPRYWMKDTNHDPKRNELQMFQLGPIKKEVSLQGETPLYPCVDLGASVIQKKEESDTSSVSTSLEDVPSSLPDPAPTSPTGSPSSPPPHLSSSSPSSSSSFDPITSHALAANAAISPERSGFWRCDICRGVYRRKKRALVHFLNKHAGVRVACNGLCGLSECKKSFACLEALDTHAKAVEITCGKCGRSLLKKNILRHKRENCN